MQECSAAISTQVTSIQQCANKHENENIAENWILSTQIIEDETPKEVQPIIEDRFTKIHNDHTKFKTKLKKPRKLCNHVKQQIKFTFSTI